jgi:hypothetical protein
LTSSTRLRCCKERLGLGSRWSCPRKGGFWGGVAPTGALARLRSPAPREPAVGRMSRW